MKKIKKLMALVIALAMVLGMMGMTVLATDGDFSETAESTVSVTNLEIGDGAVYYQLIKRNTDTGAWELAADYGVSLEELVDGVTSEEAAVIANAIKNADPAITPGTMSVANGTATAEVAPGMYYVLVTPGDTNDVIYNPIFVSADYYEGGNSIAATAEYTDKAVAKKQLVSVTKTMDNTDDKDVKIGQVIPFTVTTNLPSYTDAYSKKEFELTDTLDAGLALVSGSVTVEVAGDANLTADKDYTLTEKSGGSGYVLSFSKGYLDKVIGNPAVTIKYNATVTTDALVNVTEFDNNVTLKYTHDINENTKEITKKTRHYTFSIDAKLLGSQGDETITEDFIKVAVDANGNPVYVTDEATKRVIDSNTTVSALKGAKFELKGVTDPTVSLEITTNEKGEISAYGLDAGIYTLQEISAPAGFIKDSTTYYFEICPVYANDDDGVAYLVSYTIRFADKAADLNENHTVKSYTMTNDSDTKTVTKIEGTDITGEDTQIRNTQGAALPSTGGIGTTIFYVVGAILVIGAGVVLVTKRRMNQ